MDANLLDSIDQLLASRKAELEKKPAEPKPAEPPAQKKIRKENPKKATKGEDHLKDWPANDFRIFVGNLGDEITDDHLIIAFRKYPSFLKAKVIKQQYTGKSKGYGFVSLGNVNDYIKAMTEMEGKYIGKKPINLKPSEHMKHRK